MDSAYGFLTENLNHCMNPAEFWSGYVYYFWKQISYSHGLHAMGYFVSYNSHEYSLKRYDMVRSSLCAMILNVSEQEC